MEHEKIQITYTYPGNGSTKTFPIRWPFIDRRYVKVFLSRNPADDTELYDKAEDITTLCEWLSNSQIKITPAPPSGSVVIITRQTPFDQTLATLTNGSNFLADDLNLVNDQLLHLIQETKDYSQQVQDYVSGKYAEDAAESAESAKDSATDAANSAKSAAGRAKAAAVSATAAKVSETNSAVSAGQAKADADRAAELVDPASLASSVFNVRKAQTLEAGAAGQTVDLLGYYYPTRDLLLLFYNGTVLTPMKPGVEPTGDYSYEEVGDDPNAKSNKVRLYFATQAGDVLDMFVVASAAASALEAEASADRAEEAAAQAKANADLAAAEVKAKAEQAVNQAYTYAGQAKADADRAARLVDPASLASGVYNVRKAQVLAAGDSGQIVDLLGYYYPRRDVLYLSYNGTVCTPVKPGVEPTGDYQYEEIGTDPNVESNRVKLHFVTHAGDILDMFVVASAAGRNIERIEALVANAAASATAADGSALEAEASADRAEEAAATLPDISQASAGDTVTVETGPEGGLVARWQPPSAGAPTQRVDTELVNPIAAGGTFTVPQYTVEGKKLTVYLDGVLCAAGAAGLYLETGAAGSKSTTITLNDTLEAGWELAAIVAG